MKEATGELNMTVVTIIAIGAVIAFFWIMWPNIRDSITGTWQRATAPSEECGDNQHWNASTNRCENDRGGTVTE